jgi:hypothetical protein
MPACASGETDCRSGLIREAISSASAVGECPNPPAPVLRAMPENITFNFVQGGLIPVPRSVFVGNAGTGTLEFDARSAESWFSVEPTTGSVRLAASDGLPRGLGYI